MSLHDACRASTSRAVGQSVDPGWPASHRQVSTTASVAQLGALFAEVVEELQYRLGVAALGRPHQPAGIVIHHAREIPLALAVGDLVDPDAA
jgi:hypothetical protein